MFVVVVVVVVVAAVVVICCTVDINFYNYAGFLLQQKTTPISVSIMSTDRPILLLILYAIILMSADEAMMYLVKKILAVSGEVKQETMTPNGIETDGLDIIDGPEIAQMDREPYLKSNGRVPNGKSQAGCCV